MGRRGRGIPDRWLNYSALGERIVGTCFISFKVPLKEGLINGLPENERFTTQTLMESVPNIGLVIDLTNTDRYYNSKDFLGQGIRYEKIFCRGHELPSQSVVDKFFSIVDEYVEHLRSSSDEHSHEKLIGVHCTHGLNRTGYLVCRYMIRRLGISPEEAISAFEKARGYPMERELYLTSLRNLGSNPMPTDDGVHLENPSIADASRNGENLQFSTGIEASPNFRPNFRSDSSGPQHSWDMRTNDFSDFSHPAGANNFQRFPTTNGFRSFSGGMGTSSYTWPTGNNRDEGFHYFSNYSHARTGHPYQRELGAFFDTEERVSHNSRAVSRRFCKQDYEESEVMRSHRYDGRARSTSLFRDSRRRLNMNSRKFDNSV